MCRTVVYLCRRPHARPVPSGLGRVRSDEIGRLAIGPPHAVRVVVRARDELQRGMSSRSSTLTTPPTHLIVSPVDRPGLPRMAVPAQLDALDCARLLEVAPGAARDVAPRILAQLPGVNRAMARAAGQVALARRHGELDVKGGHAEAGVRVRDWQRQVGLRDRMGVDSAGGGEGSAPGQSMRIAALPTWNRHLGCRYSRCPRPSSWLRAGACHARSSGRASAPPPC